MSAEKGTLSARRALTPPNLSESEETGRTRCTQCNRNFPLTGSVCYPCTNDLYNQDQDQDEDQDQDQVVSSRDAVDVNPGPGLNSEGEEPELRRLERAHANGDLEPEALELGKLPPWAGRVMREVAEHMRSRFALRLAAGDDRPLPYAASEAVRAGIAPNKGSASNALNALCRAHVFEHVGSLPPIRPGLDGTKLYEIGEGWTA